MHLRLVWFIVHDVTFLSAEPLIFAFYEYCFVGLKCLINVEIVLLYMRDIQKRKGQTYDFIPLFVLLLCRLILNTHQITINHYESVHLPDT